MEASAGLGISCGAIGEGVIDQAPHSQISISFLNFHIITVSCLLARVPKVNTWTMATPIQDNLVKKNEEYASSFQSGDLTLPPAKKYAVGGLPFHRFFPVDVLE